MNDEEDNAPWIDPWEEHTDETSGLPFYINKETGEHVRVKPEPPPHAIKRGCGLKKKRQTARAMKEQQKEAALHPQLSAQLAQNAKKTPLLSSSKSPCPRNGL